jgi:hypothetical protein
MKASIPHPADLANFFPMAGLLLRTESWRSLLLLLLPLDPSTSLTEVWASRSGEEGKLELPRGEEGIVLDPVVWVCWREEKLWTWEGKSWVIGEAMDRLRAVEGRGRDWREE